MNSKVLLILVDGMRPDALEQLKIPYYMQFKKESTYCIAAKTVMPSITLPCHLSLFLSVTPDRHGTFTNTYATQVRPVDGLCEQLTKNGKSCAFFYNWEELRDLTRPGSLVYSSYNSGVHYGFKSATEETVKDAIKIIPEINPDFAFVYLGYPDEAGHKFGWMSETYMESLKHSWDMIEQLVSKIPDDYQVIITADHGGHLRIHGEDVPEDMLIPILCKGDSFKQNTELSDIGIMDIAPTVAKILNVEPNTDWEGKPLI